MTKQRKSRQGIDLDLAIKEVTERMNPTFVRQTFGEPGYDPVVFLAHVSVLPSEPMDLRVKCAEVVSKYVHAQKKAVEHTGPEGGPIEVKTELIGRILKALEQTKKS